MLRLAQVGFWWAGLVPLVVYLWFAWAARTRALPLGILAGAFAVSFVADAFGRVGLTWQAAAVYPVLQFGLVFAVLVRFPWAVAATGLVAAAAFWAAETVEKMGSQVLPVVTLAVPAALVAVLGSALVCGMVWGREDMGRVQWALLIYFGLGGLAKGVFPLLMEAPTAFLVVWVGYQACRMVGLALVTAALLRDQKVRVA